MSVVKPRLANKAASTPDKSAQKLVTLLPLTLHDLEIICRQLVMAMVYAQVALPFTTEAMDNITS
jgi:hypothetical protein